MVRNIHITFHLKFFRVNRQYRRDLAGEYTEKVTFFPRLSPSRVSRAPLRASLKNAEKKKCLFWCYSCVVNRFCAWGRRASSQRAALHDSVRTFSPSLSTDDFTPKGEKELGRSLYWLCQPFICYPSVNYSRPPIIRTFKGNTKKFKLSGVRVIEGSSYLPDSTVGLFWVWDRVAGVGTRKKPLPLDSWW